MSLEHLVGCHWAFDGSPCRCRDGRSPAAAVYQTLTRKLTMNIDYQSADSIEQAITTIQAQIVAIAGKTERGEALTASELCSLAHWAGIAQGVLSERASALRAGRPLNHRAQVMDFYVKQSQAERQSAEECVLLATSIVSLGVLRLWAADADKPLRQVIAQAELFRRKEGPDPRESTALLETASDLLQRQADAADKVGFPHLADALRQGSSEGEASSRAPEGPSTHPERQSCVECGGIHAVSERHQAVHSSPYWRRP